MNKRKLGVQSTLFKRGLILKYMYVIHICCVQYLLSNKNHSCNIIDRKIKTIKNVKSRLVKTLHVLLDSPDRERHLSWLNERMERFCITHDEYLYALIQNVINGYDECLEVIMPYGDQNLHIRIR